MREAVIVGAARTAIGNFGESLKDIPASQLAAIAIKGVMKRAGLKPKRNPDLLKYAPQVFKDGAQLELEKKYYDWDSTLQDVNVDEVILGNVIGAGQGQNPARQATIFAGMNKEVTAYTINKLRGSGMKAIALVNQAIVMGEANVVIAGGAENMSAAPYLLPKARWGARMFNAEMVDALIYDGLLEYFYNYHMGMTAENIAEIYGITRQEQDELALMSNQRAIAAIKRGIFKEEIVPIEIKEKKSVRLFDVDEHPRETSLEALARLSPVFKKDGTVTAGNSSGVTDGAAAVVMMSAEKAKELGLKPMATIKAYAVGGVDPAYMGLGMIPAVKKVMEISGLTLNDMDAIELNEAFAAQALGVVKELGLNLNIINPYGSGISLGHPVGCTGTRITVTLLHEMIRKNAKYGLATLCMGGGQGMALILERN
jgi:acetyl-CoA C-acetyltransferase